MSIAHEVLLTQQKMQTAAQKEREKRFKDFCLPTMQPLEQKAQTFGTNCVNCGAPHEHHATTCSYCGSKA